MDFLVVRKKSSLMMLAFCHNNRSSYMRRKKRFIHEEIQEGLKWNIQIETCVFVERIVSKTSKKDFKNHFCCFLLRASTKYLRFLWIWESFSYIFSKKNVKSYTLLVSIGAKIVTMMVFAFCRNNYLTWKEGNFRLWWRS